MRLPEGYPFNEDISKKFQRTRILDAMQIALDFKCKSERANSRNLYINIHRVFTEWINRKRYDKLSVYDFGGIRIREFFDYIMIERKIGSTTYNNYKIILGGMFNELISRGYLSKNPLDVIAKQKVKKKVRRPFTKEEKEIVSAYIKENDKVLFLAVCLQYYCFIRPSELCRLKFKNFDLKKGTLNLKSNQTKNWKDSVITIPNVLMPLLAEMNFKIYPSNYFLFGASSKKLGSDKPHHRNTLARKHKQVIDHLYKTEKLLDITGLQFSHGRIRALRIWLIRVFH